MFPENTGENPLQKFTADVFDTPSSVEPKINIQEANEKELTAFKNKQVEHELLELIGQKPKINIKQQNDNELKSLNEQKAELAIKNLMQKPTALVKEQNSNEIKAIQGQNVEHLLAKLLQNPNSKVHDQGKDNLALLTPPKEDASLGKLNSLDVSETVKQIVAALNNKNLAGLETTSIKELAKTLSNLSQAILAKLPADDKSNGEKLAENKLKSGNDKLASPNVTKLLEKPEEVKTTIDELKASNDNLKAAKNKQAKLEMVKLLQKLLKMKELLKTKKDVPLKQLQKQLETKTLHTQDKESDADDNDDSI